MVASGKMLVSRSNYPQHVISFWYEWCKWLVEKVVYDLKRGVNDYSEI